MNAQYQAPPELDIDKVLGLHHGMRTPEQQLERAIVWNLGLHLQAAGWTLKAVDDGEEYTRVTSLKDALELVFNLDEATIVFCKDQHAHGVLLVLGNGRDIIADYGYTEGDPDGFVAAIESFDSDALELGC